MELLRASVALRRAKEQEAGGAAAIATAASERRAEARGEEEATCRGRPKSGAMTRAMTLLELLAHTERARVQLRWLAGLCHCAVSSGQPPLDPSATCRWQRAGDGLRVVLGLGLG